MDTDEEGFWKGKSKAHHQGCDQHQTDSPETSSYQCLLHHINKDSLFYGVLTSSEGVLTESYIIIKLYLCVKPTDRIMTILTSLPNLFVQGGLLIMSILSLLLICLLLAAWKAPAWVKEIGIMALIVALTSIAAGWYKAADTLVQVNGAISPGILWSGVRCHMIVLVYGLIIYLVSLIIRMIRKPKI